MPEFENLSYLVGFITGFLLGMVAMIFIFAGLVAWKLSEEGPEGGQERRP